MNESYSMYDPATGLVVSSGTGSNRADIEFDAQRRGMSLIWQTSRPGEQYVVDGQLLDTPPKPSHKHVWNGQAWIDSTTVAEKWAEVRALRDKRLTATDYIAIRSAENAGQTPLAWRQYRQALRDITTQADPFAIDWPVPPA